ncbi:MAG: peptide deformylase [Bacteroidales bacterium]|jgi:peptide deformylase|nr:peptide deformylase [Bacteroidales bacterium]MDD3549468.1 peptide deformylase [Bacteroidales bacterium]MDD4064496.1 peptide deformylase [Bacteroidales bacterium]MDY0239490.1 peptide deformylase [Bacteroidales bacterium]NLF80987.1 peptide deformylase [Bacteroidales bacterium]
MILPIYIYGSSVLKQKALEITPDYPNLDQLIKDMWETMYYADGVGLAAPQIGLSIRMFVVDGKDLSEDRPELKDFKRLVINPRLLEESQETVVYQEGCLSVPKLYADVERPISVKLAYLNEKFEPVEEWFHGMAARMVQHEFSHLEGELFVDRLPPIRKKMIQGKLHAMARGEVKTFYKTKIVQ